MADSASVLGSGLKVRHHTDLERLAAQELTFGTLEHGEGVVYRKYFHVSDGWLYLPRGCDLSRRILARGGVEDRRVQGAKIRFSEVSHEGKYAFQIPAVEKLVSSESLVLVAGCAAGKTVMALSAAQKVGRAPLVLVHDQEMARQWQKAARGFLGIPEGEIEIFRGSNSIRRPSSASFGIGMIQTLSGGENPSPEWWSRWGILILDEVHRVAAPVWHRILMRCPARVRWGLTATYARRDGLEKLLHAHLGPDVLELQTEQLPCKVLGVPFREAIPEEFYTPAGCRQVQVPVLLSHLASLPDRNRLILDSIQPALEKRRRVMILSERNRQLVILHKALVKAGVSSGLLIGATPREARDAMRSRAQVLCVTMNYGRQALDVPHLDTLVMGTPIPANPPCVDIEQSVGRIRRHLPNKQPPVIVDILDYGVPKCMQWAMQRARWYKKQGWKRFLQRERNDGQDEDGEAVGSAGPAEAVQ